MKSVLFALALSSPGVSLAAPPTPIAATSAEAAAIDPAALSAANRLLDAMDYDRLVDRMNEAMIGEAKRSIPARIEVMTGQSLSPELRDKLIATMVQSLLRVSNDNRAALRRGTALIYARHFTAPEIDRMAELQKDPVMVKMQTKLPLILAESMALSSAAMEQEMPKLIEQLKQLVVGQQQGSTES